MKKRAIALVLGMFFAGSAVTAEAVIPVDMTVMEGQCSEEFSVDGIVYAIFTKHDGAYHYAAAVNIDENFSEIMERENGILSIPEFAEDFTVEAINDETFAQIDCIREVILPENMCTIGRDAFSECKNLAQVDFSRCSWLTYIGVGAFSGTALSEVTFPMGSPLEVIGDCAFNMSNVERIDLQNCTQLRVIGADAFSYNPLAYEGLIIPASVERIGTNAFFYDLEDDDEQPLIVTFANRTGTEAERRLMLGREVFPARSAFVNEASVFFEEAEYPDFEF